MASTNPNLAAITAAGTAVWLDQIRRDLITEGELARLVKESSLRGVTSNPAIFEKAILGADLYDDIIAKYAGEGYDARSIYQEIAIRDVQDACDVLRPVYDELDHADGFVSLEVDPDLAHDSDKTIAQAREYWERVDRPNLMIKIPGTEECVPAIETAISEGINVNVTLLFSVESYTTIAEAYIRGIETRARNKEGLDVHSVASFFVSRVDTLVDERLGDGHELRGKAGLANARAAYAKYKELFESERFSRLQQHGAFVQRPLWASTGVKDPAYADTMYVDGLLAPETVNTMPMDTLKAAADHGEVEGATADIDPTEELDALAGAGIDMGDVTKTLLDDGIAKFVTPMEDLLAGIETKRQAVVLSRPAGVSSQIPSDLQGAVGQKIAVAEGDSIASRIWAKDDTVFGPAGQPEVSNRLGWLDVAERVLESAPHLRGFADGVRADGITDVVLLGMGGSSLAPEVLRQSFGPTGDDGLKLHVLDSTDGDAVHRVLHGTDPANTLVLVSTKSGGTIETLSAFEAFWARHPDGTRFAAITDPGSGLVKIAEEHGFREVFLNDANIGGRYSALSHFGMVPAALLDVDVEDLLGAARDLRAQLEAPTAEENPGLWLGVVLGELSVSGRDKLTLVVDDPFASLGLWLEQLVAESTGKEGKGILPIADEPLGEPDVYTDDRVFLHLRNPTADADEHDDRLEALAKAGHPVLSIDVAPDAAGLGRTFLLTEFAVAVAGWALGINPFDQPNVQEAKDATKEVLEGFQSAGSLPTVEDAGDDELDALFAGAVGGYVAIMGYTAPDEAVDEAIADLRIAIRARTRATTTFGYGPRFLHSTGQLHKGGPATGRFLQLVHPATDDVEIPKTTYSFETLKAAQALGDLNTLRAHDLPAERITLADPDAASAIRTLIDLINGN